MIFPDINRYLNTIKFTLLNDISIDSITRYLLAYLAILISCLSSISGDLTFVFSRTTQHTRAGFAQMGKNKAAISFVELGGCI